MKMKTLAAMAAAFAVSAPVYADSKVKLGDVLSASDITVSGRAEAGFDYANTNNAGAPSGAAFNKGDSFVLHQVGLNIAKAPSSGIGAAVTLLGGEDARSLVGDELMVLQGYVSYASGPLTVIAGRFLTLAGAEVIDASANFNSSRGALFGVQPTFHDGVRATLKMSDALTLNGGLMNSVGQVNTDNDHNKTVELNAIFVAGTLTNSLTAYISDDGNPKSGRNIFVDYVGTLAVSPMTTLAVNADYSTWNLPGTDGKNYGIAAYINQKLDASNRVALRGEYLHTNGFGPGQFSDNVKSITATFGHAVSSNFELAAEARYDHTNEGNDIFNTYDPDSQYILSLRGVYKF